MRNTILILIGVSLVCLAAQTEPASSSSAPKEPEVAIALMPLLSSTSGRSVLRGYVCTDHVVLKIANPTRRRFNARATLTSKKNRNVTTASVAPGETSFVKISIPRPYWSLRCRQDVTLGVEDMDTGKTVLSKTWGVGTTWQNRAQADIEVSQSVMDLLAWWNVWKMGKTPNILPEDIHSWPVATEAYSSAWAVWLMQSEYDAASPELRETLEQFVREGGTLLVGGAKRKDGYRPARYEDVVLKDEKVFLGRKIVVDDFNYFAQLLAGQASFAVNGSAAQKRLERLPIMGAHLAARGALVETPRLTMTKAEFLTRVIVFSAILLIIGPGVLVFMRYRKHPLGALVATPVAAILVSIVSLGAWWFFFEDERNDATRGIICLDQNTSAMFAFCMQSARPPYVGSVTRVFSGDIQMELASNGYDSIRTDADTGVSQHRLKSEDLREMVHFSTRHRGQWSGKLNITIANGICEVENALGADIQELVVVDSEKTWHKSMAPVANGGTQTLTARPRAGQGAGKKLTEIMQDIALDDSEGALDFPAASACLPPGYYACVLTKLPDGLAVRRGVSGKTHFIVIGKYR